MAGAAVVGIPGPLLARNVLFDGASSCAVSSMTPTRTAFRASPREEPVSLCTSSTPDRAPALRASDSCPSSRRERVSISAAASAALACMLALARPTSARNSVSSVSVSRPMSEACGSIPATRPGSSRTLSLIDMPSG
jgi:hypothetical protein